MKNKLVLLSGVILIFVLGAIFSTKFFPKKEIHYHAGFKVFVDGKLQDFSSAKYMSIKLCGGDEKEHKEDEQLEKAHLHDGVGDVVHVEAEGAKWLDLFKNIRFNIDPAKPIEAYVNGEKVTNILNYPIKQYDSVVILMGKNINTKAYLNQSVKKEYIKKVEKESESC